MRNEYYPLKDTYIDLISKIRSHSCALNTFPIDMCYHDGFVILTIERIAMVTKRLKTRRVFHKPKYQWLKNKGLIEYITSPDCETFMVGYQILEERGIV